MILGLAHSERGGGLNKGHGLGMSRPSARGVNRHFLDGT
jgi:hypothetical protein